MKRGKHTPRWTRAVKDSPVTLRRREQERVIELNARSINAPGGIVQFGKVECPSLFLIDFKVLLLEKPGGAPKASFSENQGYRWYSQR